MFETKTKKHFYRMSDGGGNTIFLKHCFINYFFTLNFIFLQK